MLDRMFTGLGVFSMIALLILAEAFLERFGRLILISRGQYSTPKLLNLLVGNLAVALFLVLIYVLGGLV